MRNPRTPVWRSRALVLGMLGLVVTVPVAPSGAQVRLGCATVLKGDEWAKLALPDFPSGPATLTAYAVSPTEPSTVYVSNGVTIMRSFDGGCAWDQVLELTPTAAGDVELSSLTTRITSIVVSPSTTRPRLVMATAVEVESGVGRPHLLRSESGNISTWGLGDAGLPAAGTPTRLRLAQGNANAAYLALRSVPAVDPGTGGVPPLPGVPGNPVTPGEPIGALYRTADGGATWTAASDGTDFVGAPAVEDVAIDPAASSTVWVVAGGYLRKSADSGRTYTDAGLSVSSQAAKGYKFRAVNVGDGGSVVGFADAPGGAQALVSTNGGGSFKAQKAPAGVRSVARIDANRLAVGVVANGEAGIYRYDLRVARSLFTRPELSPVDFAVSTDRRTTTVYASSPSALYRSIPPPAEAKFDPSRPNSGKLPPLNLPPATLSPRQTTVHLDLGRTKTIEYTLALPRRPTPLDVYLLIDNSKSMKRLIDEVQAELVTVLQALVRQGIDVHVGLGMYQTTEDPPLYIRLADVQKPDAPLYTALGQLTADSTGTDEPVLIALHQAALGRGMSARTLPLPTNPCIVVHDPNVCAIPRGQQANFVRPEAIRVFLHATNERFDKNIEGIDPAQQVDYDEAAAALNSRNIEHVGIAVNEDAEESLKRMSRLTGTLAPAGGIDCDQDGHVDVRANQPIVCPRSGKLAKTLVDVLNAIEDEQPVAFVTSPVRSPVVGRVAPAGFPAVNVKIANTLRTRVTYSCVDVAPGAYDVTLRARLADGYVAEALAHVVCGSPVAPPAVQNPPANNPPAGREQPPPAPAPVVPGVPAPNIQPQAQPQPQAQTQAQAGAAAEEQDEFQVATAAIDLKTQDGQQQLAMVGLAGAALMSAACAGFALRRRDRTAVAKSLRQ